MFVAFNVIAAFFVFRIIPLSHLYFVTFAFYNFLACWTKRPENYLESVRRTEPMIIELILTLAAV